MAYNLIGIKEHISMKVLLINGSPRRNGNTSIALKTVEETLNKEGVETELVWIGNNPIRGCSACGYCREHNRCVYDDLVNELAPKLEQADGLVVGSPVYYASANASLVALLQRLFHSSAFDKTMKVGTSVTIARRGGCSATFDELNKFFAISGMPIASSCYWNSVHGRDEGEAVKDLEGLRTMRTLGKNMAFLLKSIKLGKEKFRLPEKEPYVATNFIRD